MSQVQFYATQPHYLDTLVPVARALRERGHDVMWRGDARALERLPVLWPDSRDPAHRGVPQAGAVVVAGGMDARDVAGKPDTRVAHLPHGAGQTYYGDPTHPVDSHGYAGGPDLDRVRLFCVNRMAEGALWQARYPEVRVAVTGPPCLDGLERWPLPYTQVVIAFHWPCPLVQEAGTAFDDWRAQVEVMARTPEAERGYRLGVALHPRWRGQLDVWASALGLPVMDRRDVLRSASLLVVDNSSLGYEAAALGVPTLWLNSARWRAEVHHGLRFWSDIPGPMLWPHLSLADAVHDDLGWGQGEAWRKERERVVERVYGVLDGKAAARAATAIEEAVL